MMLTYTSYSEAGGTGKTTLAANVAVSHARAGLDVLVVPLDPQDGDLSYLFDVDDQRADPEVDNLVRHLVGRGSGPFRELVRTVDSEYGIDIIPEHNMLERLGDALRREADQRETLGESFPTRTQLLRVFREAALNEDYDVIVSDPPATAGPHLYNAIHATRNLLIPVEPTGKGQAAVSGLEDLVENLEEDLGIEIGVLAAVPNRVKGTRDQAAIVDEIEALGFDVPVVIRDRASLLEGCWRQQCSAFTYVREHRNRERDYELDTLAKFDRLARHLEAQVGIEAPDPPEPGDIKHGLPEVES